ncbi:hypothetical protein RND81_12G052600 [Saponaria officinalis]|uniref:RRM domain-containing protein n=1 Tax=Saponaria officinalis TaxID=3572 RepID=A0AAW1H7A3_SAPOF
MATEPWMEYTYAFLVIICTARYVRYDVFSYHAADADDTVKTENETDSIPNVAENEEKAPSKCEKDSTVTTSINALFSNFLVFAAIVTEEQLASLFINCGQVVDCHVCANPNSVLRFAFIEFTDEEGAKNALTLSDTMLGFYPVRVLSSKTAIAPVNPTFLPRSEDEREMCARTVYCTNINKKVTQADLKSFFESYCGEVYRLRMLGDYHHSTRIAFVEFVMAKSAISALNFSGPILGLLPIRVSPSKTHVHPRPPRSPLK